jgi:hypothetical protein
MAWHGMAWHGIIDHFVSSKTSSTLHYLGGLILADVQRYGKAGQGLQFCSKLHGHKPLVGKLWENKDQYGR